MSATALARGKTSTGPLLCRWSGCEAHENGAEFDSAEELARHVRTTHVEPFESQDVVVCQWEKCKVYNVPSSSIQWLKRHVQQAHTKDRPFKCIMNGCNMSFNSSEALQRHVNRHLEPAVTPSSNSPPSSSPRKQAHTRPGRGGSGGKMTQGKRLLPSSYSLPPYPSSLYQLYLDPPPFPSDSSYDSCSEEYGQRNGRKKSLCLKVRIPRRSVSLSSLSLHCPTPYNGAHIHSDVWDHKMMSVIHQTCDKLIQNSSTPATLSVNMKATILGQRRCTLSSEDELLVRWSPHLADDSWVPVSQFSPQKSISFSQISEPYLSRFSKCFSYSQTGPRRNKRKP